MENFKRKIESKQELETGKEGDKLTHKELVMFYAKANKECKLTEEFMENYRQKDGGYIELAKAFMFYRALKETQLLEELKKLGVNIEELNVFNPGFDEDQSEPNQEWHLFISYYAYKIWESGLNWDDTVEFWDKGKGLKCPELLLWLAEAAGCDDCDIAKAKKVAEDLCKEKKRKDAPDRIKEIIPRDEINKKIKEHLSHSV